MVTTVMTDRSNDHILLNGKENYRRIGEDADNINGDGIIGALIGLNRHWDCEKKATIVRKIIGGALIFGSLHIMNNEKDGTFGYNFNPPYEFHAWVEMPETKYIYDFALPGVIENGLKTKDQYGYILKDIEPVILMGKPLKNLIYVPKFVQLN